MGRAEERAARALAWRERREAEEAERRREAGARRARREAERDGRVALWRESQGLVTQQAALQGPPAQAAPAPPPVQGAFTEEEPAPLPAPRPAPAVNNVFDLPARLKAGFDAFWGAYPRKVAKGKCLHVWLALRPDESLLARMLRALERHKASEQWKREAGQYIPHPSTWLNQQRWEDGGEAQEAAGKAEAPPPPDEADRARETLRKRQELLAKLKAVKDGSQAKLF